MKAWMAELKSQMCCTFCSETHPATLEFHHLDPSAKETTIANAVMNGWSVKRVQAEMAKCIVLCANCHRKLHAR